MKIPVDRGSNPRGATIYILFHLSIAMEEPKKTLHVGTGPTVFRNYKIKQHLYNKIDSEIFAEFQNLKKGKIFYQEKTRKYFLNFPGEKCFILGPHDRFDYAFFARDFISLDKYAEPNVLVRWFSLKPEGNIDYKNTFVPVQSQQTPLSF